MAETWESQPSPDEVGRSAGLGADQAGRSDSDARGRTTGDARPEPKARDESLDVIKAVLIILVVFCHLVEHFAARDSVFQAVYSTISMFGLPLFVLTSGMLAKPLLSDAAYRTMFAKLLLPLVCLQLIYLALLQLVDGDAVRHLLDPQWLLWFLLSLCLWRMMLPLFVRIPMALPVAIVLTLAAGYAEYIGPDLSISRTLYYFPFFLAGYLWRERLPRIVARARLAWGLAFSLLVAGAVLWSMHGLDPGVVYADRGYDRATVWAAFPALGRLGFLFFAALGCVSWMAIMPRRSGWLARLGRRTLTILALHGFLVLICYKLFNLAGWTSSPTPAFFPALLAVAIAIAWVVSLLDSPFNGFFSWLAARLSSRSAGTPRA